MIVSPLPGSAGALPRTQISFLGARATALTHISVVGSRSGAHRGRLRSYSSATGASFLPRKAFVAGERVTVHALLRHRSGVARLSTSFTVAAPASVPPTQFPSTVGSEADVQSFHSEPALHPPVVTVRQAAGPASAPGYLLATPFLGPGQWGPMIFDSSGRLIWFHPLPADEDAADLRTQVYHGRNDLTWWQGRTITLGYGLGEDVIADANYRTVATVRAGNGLQADEHEFTITPQGTAYITAYSPVAQDLTPVGGAAHGIAIDCAVQEVDIRTGLVMWEWHSLGHVGLDESHSPAPGTPANAYDYFHLNSVDLDAHGDLLLSARNTWALYDVDHHTGAIRWRLGGKRSSFTLGAGVAFAYQHDATWLGAGEIGLFDDEGAPPVAPPSRGEAIALDPAAHTATLARSLVRTAPVTTSSQGDLQALPTGGWLVGFGGLPNFTEFDSAGAQVYDAQLPAGENSYRVYRQPWAGQPTSLPAVAADATTGTTIVYASWNGATTVASWQLLTGSDAHSLSAVSTTPWGGFETAIAAPAAPLYEVRALSATGKVLATSRAVGAPGA
ncbi:MAG TPA: arylsulfotransferase family protein [Solirubrobacteraceae bacterium]|nr:arylsulfotransferase family protein [Solirubrobacteraceae bacterium]